ncbi:MAG: hypothetical protein MR650_06555, partial [Bacteroides uniformis]|nr:hypothetical protein [Bacteroides uniformis]
MKYISYLKILNIAVHNYYTEIATTYIEEVKDSLEYTYFNLQDYQHLLDRTDSSASRKLIELYK